MPSENNKTSITERRIAVVGVFDGVHLGHCFLFDCMLKQARERGLLPMAITFRRHPLNILKPGMEPMMLNTLQERLGLIKQCGIENCLLLDFDASLCVMTASQFLEMLKIKYNVGALMLGFNNRFGSDGINDFSKYYRIGKKIGVEILKAPQYGNGISSTAVRNLISRKQIEDANRLLGYKYAIEGVVVKGNQIGRTIGFPTANIEVVDDKKLIPPKGVYVVDALITNGVGKKRYRSILNIGRRPTVSGECSHVTIEMHIIDFEGDLYGAEIRVEFLDFVREEQQFSTLEDLKKQILRDKQLAIEFDEIG